MEFNANLGVFVEAEDKKEAREKLGELVDKEVSEDIKVATYHDIEEM